MTELSAYVLAKLREGEFTLYRGLGDGLPSILLVAPAGEYQRKPSAAMPKTDNPSNPCPSVLIKMRFMPSSRTCRVHAWS